MSQFEIGNTGVSGTLTIFVHRGKELINVKKTDKQSPFVILRVGHMTCRSKVCFRGGQKPDWSFVAKFQITPEIKPILDIDCFHETGNAPKFIGKTKVDFTSAVFANEEDGDDRWVELKNGVEYAGKIYLEMSFVVGSSSSHGLMGGDELGNSFSSNINGDNFKRFSERNNSILDDIKVFEQSVSEREIPQVMRVSHVGLGKNGNPYQHGVVTSEPGINDYLNSKNSLSSNSVSTNSQFGSLQHQAENLEYRKSNYSSEFEGINSQNNINNNNGLDAIPSSSAGSTSSSSEPLFAKLRELKGKMFNFKNQQGGSEATHQNYGNKNINNRGDDFFNPTHDNRNLNQEQIYNNNFNNSKSSKNSQLSKEQLDFQILEQAIAGGLPLEQSINDEKKDYFNVNDGLPPLPNHNMGASNNYKMGGRIESAKTFSKSRVASQPMMPIFNKSRRPPPPQL